MMNIDEARNPVFMREDQSLIDLEILHPVYGWLPFTANPADSEAHGRDLYIRALAGEFGPIGPYVPPAP